MLNHHTNPLLTDRFDMIFRDTYCNIFLDIQHVCPTFLYLTFLPFPISLSSTFILVSHQTHNFLSIFHCLSLFNLLRS
ncbi:hypothetical protein RJT34_23906 [Clitoria ternatea]|uniref:Uncharacterized protein n=1 Tax=Clitoria ternatea TaxID=43366 RepID=A0AAN9FLV7_CLITE